MGWALKEAARTQGWRAQWAPALRKTGLLLLLPLASIELTCLANQCMFGFWGTTEIQSAPFQSCLRDLMAIQPSEVGLPRYVMVPRSSLKLAYAASPTFAKTEPYFEANLGGKGWSAYVSDPGQAGNIDGGHFEWALLDSAAFAAGGSPAAAGVFFKAVSRELDAALAGGGLPRRRLWLPMFGPGFTPWSWAGLDSLAKVGARDLDLSPGPLPKYALQDPDPQVEDDYNRLGSRASGVVTNGVWRASGWVLDPARGLPEKIALDPAAQAAGIQLRLIERKDVADAMLKNPAKARPLCGFQVVSPGSLDGNLVVTAPGRRYSVPISSLVTPGNGGAGGLHVQVDGMAGPHVPHLEAQTWVSAGVYLAMKFCLFLALGLGGVGLILRTRFPDAAWRRGAALVGMLAFSVAVPRLLLFACLDLSMCSGLEMRYMSAGVFSAWFFAAFTVAGLAVQIILRRNLFRVRAH
ncbi:MAG TPA: hypothetical protein VNZ67_06810 [bacterium]|nr:hypothetical protein [bacterium]